MLNPALIMRRKMCCIRNGYGFIIEGADQPYLTLNLQLPDRNPTITRQILNNDPKHYFGTTLLVCTFLPVCDMIRKIRRSQENCQ